ncbi:hypothetical protein BDV12DRAFT_16512 [Aspergillus spectabilis]
MLLAWVLLVNGRIISTLDFCHYCRHLSERSLLLRNDERGYDKSRMPRWRTNTRGLGVGVRAGSLLSEKRRK